MPGRWQTTVVRQTPALCYQAPAPSNTIHKQPIGNKPSSVVTTVVTDTFEASHPAEADLMRNLSFTNAMMNGLLAWQDKNKATGDEAAVYFLSTQQDIWSDWLNDAARDKLAALLQ